MADGEDVLADQRLTRPRRRLSPSASKWHLRCVNRVVEAIMNGNSDSDALAAAQRLTPVILTSREGNDGATIVQRMELKIDAAALVGRPLEVRSKGQGERRRPAERSRAVRFRHSCSIARRPVASWWSCPTSSGAEAQSDICIYNLSGGSSYPARGVLNAPERPRGAARDDRGDRALSEGRPGRAAALGSSPRAGMPSRWPARRTS